MAVKRGVPAKRGVRFSERGLPAPPPAVAAVQPRALTNRLDVQLYPSRVERTAAAMVPFDVGGICEVHAVWLADGQPVTPTTVTAVAVAPTGAVIAQPPVQQDALTIFRTVLTAPGRWVIRVTAQHEEQTLSRDLVVWAREAI
jgi:hypothetical protein